MIGQCIAVSGVAMFLVAAAVPMGADMLADERGQQVAVERRAVEQVERVSEAGREIQFHAERLNALAGDMAVSRWSHYEHLESIKVLVNRQLRPALTRLAAMQKRLPDWKQDAIDRMTTAAQDMVADTDSAIFRKNDRPLTPAAMNEEYKQLVRSLATHAGTLVSTADAAHDFAVAHLKATEAGLPVNK